MASKTQIDAVIKAIKAYWQEHEELDFGQMLDSIMFRKGDIRDMSRLASDDLVLYIQELLKEEKVFTKEQLSKLRENRLKEYYTSSDAKKRFIKEPIPLFINGRFSMNNYFGGDDIIRSFFTEISENEEPIMFPEVTFDMKDKTYVVGLTAMKLETTHYICFLFTTSGMSLKFQDSKPIFNVGIFGFTKENLDNIEFAWFNGEEMKEEDYLFILNTLKTTGFNFFIDQPKKLPMPSNKEVKNEIKHENKQQENKGKKK